MFIVTAGGQIFLDTCMQASALAAWKQFAAHRQAKRTALASCRRQLQAQRSLRQLAAWRQRAARGAQLRGTCAALVHLWRGRTQNAALLSWRVCAQELAADRCTPACGDSTVSVRQKTGCLRLPMHRCRNRMDIAVSMSA